MPTLVIPEDLMRKLDRIFHRFNSIRKKRLKLYPHVKETLTPIFQLDIQIVGYTESAEENGFYRLRKLGIADLFQHVYVSDSQLERPDYTVDSFEQLDANNRAISLWLKMYGTKLDCTLRISLSTYASIPIFSKYCMNRRISVVR